MPTIHTVLCWSTIALLVVSWVLILLPSITATEGTDLSLANVIATVDGQEHVARFGILNSRSEDRIRSPDTSSSQHVGYSGGVQLLQEEPFGYGGNPPRTYMRQITVLHPQDTDPLVMFPVSLGLLSLALIVFCFASATRRIGFQAFAAVVTLTSVGVGWAAWGCAFALSSLIDSRLERYREDSRGLWDVRSETGDAIWPGLVGVICLTVSAFLIIGAMYTRPREPDAGKEAEGTEMRTTKETDSGDAERDSQNTAV